MGAMLLQQGVEYFIPTALQSVFCWKILAISQAEANIAAWHEGKRLLEHAVAERLDFAFETTLGGTTIASLLDQALSQGIEVRVWYVGLEGADLHLVRVRSPVEEGGHDIPEERIRERYIQSRLNLIRLLPRLTELLVYDNSEEANPAPEHSPNRDSFFAWFKAKCGNCPLIRVPEWAKPILAAALKLKS